MKIPALISRLFIKLVGQIQLFPFPFFLVLYGDTHYKIKGPETRKLINTIKPGDILLRRFDRYITCWGIKGFYKHAAIVGNDNNVIQAVTVDGVSKEDILTFCRADSIAVLRIIDPKENEIENAIKLAEEQLGKSYDFAFSIADKGQKFYCTELVAYCYKNRFKDLKLEDSSVIHPDDFLHEKVQVIHDSRIFQELI